MHSLAEIRSLSLLRRLRLFHSTHRILPPPPECLGPDSSVIVPYTGQNTSGNPPTGYHQQDANFCPCPAPILQNPGDLTIHLRNVHFIRNEVRKQNNTELQHSSTGACPFPFCAAPIRRPKDAVKHLRSAHFNGNGVQISSYNSLEYLDTGRFICEVPGCGASILIRNRSFVNHYKEHFIRYFCPENGCKYHASRRNLLVRHARLKHDGRVDVKNVLPAFVTGFH
jgi:hypothetical protein